MNEKPPLDQQLLELFAQEVKERAAELESLLLRIENAADAQEANALQERLLRIVHSLKGAAGLVEVRPLEAVCHGTENLLARLKEEGKPLEGADLDLLLKATDVATEAGLLLARGKAVPMGLVEGVLQQLEAARTRKGRRKSKATKKSSAAGALPTPPIRVTDLDGSLRLSADRLEALSYRSSELISSRSRIRLRSEQAEILKDQARRLRAASRGGPVDLEDLENGLRALASCLADDERYFRGSITALDQEVRRARVQRFARVCQGLPRMVRDMAQAMGKAAQLEVIGGDIEIDRSILAGLQDALRHLVRNAVGHGIEMPEARRKAGKAPVGTIVISAELRGDSLKVTVADDGQGFDLKSIRRAARELELGSGDQEGFRDIFEPGLSTAPRITQLSGRGIGLDIVRRSIEAMRGTVDVCHGAGKGARFTLALPLTLSTVRALEVSTAGQIFAIDTASVQRIVKVAAADLPSSDEPNVLSADGEDIRLVDLALWLGLATQPSRAEQLSAFIVGPPGGRTAVLVESIGSEQELLARSLGARLSRLRHYSGGTVLPDGQVALLLNAAALVDAGLSDGSFDRAQLASQPSTARACRILMVDDSHAVRALGKLVLETAGYEVALASNGSEALQKLEAFEPDLLIVDVDMPEMNGLILTQTVRRSKRFAQLPVILFTSRQSAEDEAAGLGAGANAYVPKNGFDQDRFLEAVQRLCQVG